MSSIDPQASDAQFAEQVNRALTATAAIDQWERAHGKLLDKPRTIACPCCKVEDALKFVRTRHHLYVECATPECVPAFRGNCRGCR